MTQISELYLIYFTIKISYMYDTQETSRLLASPDRQALHRPPLVLDFMLREQEAEAQLCLSPGEFTALAPGSPSPDVPIVRAQKTGKNK